MADHTGQVNLAMPGVDAAREAIERMPVGAVAVISGGIAVERREGSPAFLIWPHGVDLNAPGSDDALYCAFTPFGAARLAMFMALALT